jgi:hypothetical protein
MKKLSHNYTRLAIVFMWVFLIGAFRFAYSFESGTVLSANTSADQLNPYTIEQTDAWYDSKYTSRSKIKLPNIVQDTIYIIVKEGYPAFANFKNSPFNVAFTDSYGTMRLEHILLINSDSEVQYAVKIPYDLYYTGDNSIYVYYP